MSARFQMPKGVRANALARRRLLWDAARVSGAARAMREACREENQWMSSCFFLNFKNITLLNI